MPEQRKITQKRTPLKEVDTKRKFLVCKIVRIGSVGLLETSYGLVQVKSFDSRREAEQWILQEGKRHIDYTVFEVFQKE